MDPTNIDTFLALANESLGSISKVLKQFLEKPEKKDYFLLAACADDLDQFTDVLMEVTEEAIAKAHPEFVKKAAPRGEGKPKKAKKTPSPATGRTDPAKKERKQRKRKAAKSESDATASSTTSEERQVPSPDLS
jgi:hypothetical protein